MDSNLEYGLHIDADCDVVQWMDIHICHNRKRAGLLCFWTDIHKNQHTKLSPYQKRFLHKRMSRTRYTRVFSFVFVWCGKIL